MRFRSEVRWTSDLIDERINIYIGLLRGGVAFLAANPNPTRQEFRAYVERLKLPQHYPGIQGIGFAKRVRPEEKNALIQTLQAQGDTGFEIRPPGNREEYFPILFLYPLDERNQHAIGYDMFSEPVRHEAMARARDAGQSVASGKVTLVQEIYEQKQAGFLIYLPAYR
ncbi:MAG TPA: CHASE domain-containing protein, partial [Bacillota bacterium]|nr:CHASE domain-containing protein [Bacillota bacterium]